MPMFIQPFDVTEDNRHLHLYNIETANSLAYQFNQNIMAEPSSFVYNPNTKRIQLHTEFDLHPENSKVIAQQINWLLDFEEQFSDKDDYLILRYNNENYYMNKKLLQQILQEYEIILEIK